MRCKDGSGVCLTRTCVFSWVRHEAIGVTQASCATVPIKASNTEGGGVCACVGDVLKQPKKTSELR